MCINQSVGQSVSQISVITYNAYMYNENRETLIMDTIIDRCTLLSSSLSFTAIEDQKTIFYSGDTHQFIQFSRRLPPCALCVWLSAAQTATTAAAPAATATETSLIEEIQTIRDLYSSTTYTNFDLFLFCFNDFFWLFYNVRTLLLHYDFCPNSNVYTKHKIFCLSSRLF